MGVVEMKEKDAAESREKSEKLKRPDDVEGEKQ